MNRARENETEFGLLNANGWYLTKHSLGVYSCQEPDNEWNLSPLDLDVEPQIQLVEKASGEAQMETFTVLYNKFNQPEKSIVIARLGSGERCLATTDSNPQALNSLSGAEEFRLSGEIEFVDGKNMFRF